MSEQLEGLEPIDYVHPNGTKATITFRRTTLRDPNQIRIDVSFIDSAIKGFNNETKYSNLKEARSRGIKLATDWVDNWKD
ncbi:hypothetical protein ACIPIN_02155 [Pseudomonas sp. NPDC087697]|uniref:hypothetical protein n=1 Tax=Pseudomonas sp. NPDC087697 TaxID=3364447 RepID=UPI0037F7BEBD